MSRSFRSHQYRPENSHDNFTDSVIKIVNSQGRPITCDANNNLVAGSDIVPAGSDNSFFGCGAGSSQGGSCVAVGFGAMTNNLGGENNAVGFLSLEANTDGFGNVAVGSRSLNANTEGFFNIAVGGSSLRHNTTGNHNQAVGQQALNDNTTGSENVAVGGSAMVQNTVGSKNVAVGRLSLSANIDGEENVAVGFNSLVSNDSGTGNTALGRSSLLLVTSGSQNIGIGSNSGLSISTGSRNIMIGSNSAGGGFNDTTVIANGVAAGVNGSLYFRTGLPAVAGASVEYITGTGQMGPVASTIRKKKEVEDLAVDFQDVYKLRPVSFVWNENAPGLEGLSDFGLIAEEVDKIFPQIVPKDEEGKPFSVKYDKLSVLLLCALKSLEEKVSELKSLEARVSELERRPPGE